MYDLLCFSRKIAIEVFKKKKKMQESWFERGKEEGNTTLEKVRNWRCITGLRTLVFLKKKKIILYNLNLITKCLSFEPDILISVPKLRSFGISLKKKKNQYYCVSILNPKIIRYPPLSLFH